MALVLPRYVAKFYLCLTPSLDNFLETRIDCRVGKEGKSGIWFSTIRPNFAPLRRNLISFYEDGTLPEGKPISEKCK